MKEQVESLPHKAIAYFCAATLDGYNRKVWFMLLPLDD